MIIFNLDRKTHLSQVSLYVKLRLDLSEMDKMDGPNLSMHNIRVQKSSSTVKMSLRRKNDVTILGDKISHQY